HFLPIAAPDVLSISWMNESPLRVGKKPYSFPSPVPVSSGLLSIVAWIPPMRNAVGGDLSGSIDMRSRAPPSDAMYSFSVLAPAASVTKPMPNVAVPAEYLVKPEGEHFASWIDTL